MPAQGKVDLIDMPDGIVHVHIAERKSAQAHIDDLDKTVIFRNNGDTVWSVPFMLSFFCHGILLLWWLDGRAIVHDPFQYFKDFFYEEMKDYLDYAYARKKED